MNKALNAILNHPDTRFFETAEEMVESGFASMKSVNSEMVINKGPACCNFHFRGLCDGNMINFSQGFSGILRGNDCVIETSAKGKIIGKNNHVTCVFEGTDSGEGNFFHEGISLKSSDVLKSPLPLSKDRQCVIANCSTPPTHLILCSKYNEKSVDDKNVLLREGKIHEGYCRRCCLRLVGNPCLHCEEGVYTEILEPVPLLLTNKNNNKK